MNLPVVDPTSTHQVMEKDSFFASAALKKTSGLFVWYVSFYNFYRMTQPYLLDNFPVLLSFKARTNVIRVSEEAYRIRSYAFYLNCF